MDKIQKITGPTYSKQKKKINQFLAVPRRDVVLLSLQYRSLEFFLWLYQINLKETKMVI